MEDKVSIKGIKLNCNLGIDDLERSEKQIISIDVEMFLNVKKAAKLDDVKYTVNYSEVYKKVKSLAENNSFKLLETLAEKIAQLILKNFKVKKVTIIIRKTSIAKKYKCEYSEVEITRATV